MEFTAVGIDVSKDSLDVCVLEHEVKRKHRKFSNNGAGFRALEKWVSLQAPEPRHFCMESTGSYSFGPAEYLTDRGHKVSVENPRPVKHFSVAAKLKTKSDKADAFCIALYVAKMKPRDWALKDPVIREIAQLRTRMRQIEKDRLAERSRLDDRHLPDLVGLQIRQHVEWLQEQQRQIRVRVKQLMARCEQARTVYHAVTGINGVGPETGLLLATLGVGTFDEAPQVAVFFGLNPRTHQSGKLSGQTRISKEGDASGRAILVSAAYTAARCNPEFKAFFERLTARGLARKRAVIAVARKLVMVAWAIARNALQGLPVSYPGGELRKANLAKYAPAP
jgi:transposase